MKTLDSSFDGAVFYYKSIVLYTNSINHRNFTLQILNEALVTNLIVFYLSKNFYLVDEIDDKISQFKASGFIQLWSSKYFKEGPNSNRDPTSLSMEQLQGTFKVLSFGLLLSFVSFVFELKSIHKIEKVKLLCCKLKKHLKK